MHDPEVTQNVTAHTRGNWASFLRRLGTGLAGAASSPALLNFLGRAELNGLNTLDHPIDSATLEWAITVQNEVVSRFGDYQRLIPNLEAPSDQYPASLFSVLALSLHTLSDSLSLANDRFNGNAIVATAGNIEHFQNTVETYAEGILPKPLFLFLRALNEGLTYAAPALAPHLTIMLGEMINYYALNSGTTSAFLPAILGGIWTLGAIISLNDLHRVSASLIRSNQRYVAKHNIDAFTNLCNNLLGSMTESYPKFHVNPKEFIVTTLVEAGISPELAGFANEIDYSTNHLQQIVGKLHRAMANVPTSTRQKLYPDELQDLRKALIKAGQDILPHLKRAARNNHSLPR